MIQILFKHYTTTILTIYFLKKKILDNNEHIISSVKRARGRNTFRRQKSSA